MSSTRSFLIAQMQGHESGLRSVGVKWPDTPTERSRAHALTAVMHFAVDNNHFIAQSC